MYVELFLLDNLLMNLLILRLAAAMLSVRTKRWLSLAVSFAGACYAAVGAGALPVLLELPFKLMSGFAMAAALPRRRGIKGYLRSTAALFLSTFIAGGAVFALAAASNRSVSDGISFITAGGGLAVTALVPRSVRKILARRIRAESIVRLRVEVESMVIECAAIADTGCTLLEPASGLPVILLSRSRFRTLSERASIPVPMMTANGSSVILAVKPLSVSVNGMPSEALVGFSQASEAIVPAQLVI